MKQKFICIVLGLGAVIFGFIAVFAAIGAVMIVIDEFTDLDYPFWPLIVAPGLALAAGIVLGGFLSRWYSRRAGIVWDLGLGTRAVAWVLIALYVVTWAVGAPRIQTETTQWALEEWQRIHQDGNRVDLGDGLPYIQTSAAVPILPFVVASYHEYQLARLYGAGGWDIQLWYVIGTKRLFFLKLWIS